MSEPAVLLFKTASGANVLPNSEQKSQFLEVANGVLPIEGAMLMEIQSFNHNNELRSTSPKNIKGAAEVQFQTVLQSQMKSPVPGRVQLHTADLRTLVRDSFADTGKEVLSEINSLCDDETGENIDMKLLGELLELYKGRGGL